MTGHTEQHEAGEHPEGCSCMEVYGEDPACIHHGDRALIARLRAPAEQGVPIETCHLPDAAADWIEECLDRAKSPARSVTLMALCGTCRGFGYVVMAPSTWSAGGERVPCPACTPSVLFGAATPTPDSERAGGSEAAQGTFACPICGKDTPHHHSDQEVRKWRETEAWVEESWQQAKPLFFPEPTPEPAGGSGARDDEGPCTDCEDSGITIQTERACSCGAGDQYRATPERAGGGEADTAATASPELIRVSQLLADVELHLKVSRVFLTSREKMHPCGVDLHDELLRNVTAALEETGRD